MQAWGARRRTMLGLGAALGLMPGAWAQSLPSGVMPVLVLNSLDGNVSVINPQSWTEVQRLPTGKEPHHLYMTPDEQSVIVANALSDSLTFIDPRTARIQRTLGDILDPYHLRFSPDMKWLVTAGNRLNHVDIYRWDGRNPTLAKRLPTSRIPSHIWIDTRSTSAYVTMQGSNELYTIDLLAQRVRHVAETGSTPADVFVTPDDRTLLVGLTGAAGVEVFEVRQGVPVRTGILPTGRGAHAFRALGDRRHVLVSNRVENSIHLIDYQNLQVVARLPGPSGPDCMEVMRDGKTLLVASRWADRLSVIDIPSRQLLRQVRVGNSPHGVWTLDHAGRA